MHFLLSKSVNYLPRSCYKIKIVTYSTQKINKINLQWSSIENSMLWKKLEVMFGKIVTYCLLVQYVFRNNVTLGSSQWRNKVIITFWTKKGIHWGRLVGNLHRGLMIGVLIDYLIRLIKFYVKEENYFFIDPSFVHYKMTFQGEHEVFCCVEYGYIKKWYKIGKQIIISAVIL